MRCFNRPQGDAVLRIDLVYDRSDWAEALSAMNGYDFAHTYDFHHIARAYGEGEPMMVTVRNDANEIVALWPALKRGIGTTGWFDLTSVYGYAGPLVVNGICGNAALLLILDFMREQGAVSLFSRMHPLFVGTLPEGSRGRRLGDVVIIDVRDDLDVVKCYRGGHRRDIVNAGKKGLMVSCEQGQGAVADFHALYIDAMQNLDATSYYFFDKDYFGCLNAAIDFETLIFFASIDGKKVAASIFIVTEGVMQYYLSGTDENFRSLSPSKAIIAEAHRVAVQRGLRHLVLGGGVGSRQDALFEFKRGFSTATAPFHVVRNILDEARYHSLCEERGIMPSPDGFFPAYRTPA